MNQFLYAIIIICFTIVISIILFRLTRCKHIWEEIDMEETDMWFDYKKDHEKGAPMYTIRSYFYKCTKCGIHKQKKFKY